MENGGRLKPKR